MTIDKIEIANFGCFKNFVWKNNIKDKDGNELKFKRLNIIYGRNYSGKTTLSRIFRSLQTGSFSPNFKNPSFNVIGEHGSVNESIVNSAHGYDIRVYNRDFVTDNLSFLVDQNGGEIKTFAIVGERNKQIEDRIKVIEAELGSIETQSGLRHEQVQLNQDRIKKESEHRSVNDALSNKLRDHAKKIKSNRDYGESVYDIDSIKKDIKTTNLPSFVLPESDELIVRAALVRQDAMPNIEEDLSLLLTYPELLSAATTLLQRAIVPTKPIQDLLNDSVLQLWVKQGISHHKDKRKECAFCRQTLPDDIWEVLDSHFNHESSELESELDDLIKLVDDELKAIPRMVLLTDKSFYPTFQVNFKTNYEILSNELEKYKKSIEELRAKLNLRKTSLFQPVEIPTPSYSQELIDQQLQVLNIIISKHNEHGASLDNVKKEARRMLRLADVVNFAATIDYDGEMLKIEELNQTASDSKSEFLKCIGKISELTKEIETLRASQNDELKGAESVNALLNHFFGHDGIKLKAQTVEGEATVKFQILRDGHSAYHLSEGECSLIAFCYFIAKLEEPESKGKNLIIYIDDPISSLDGNHIFFLFSLIESLIAKPIADTQSTKNYKQLFISTHNLDFLKYIKRLSGSQDKHVGQFLVSRGNSNSKLEPMPDYLKNYITEFNYLFHQIFKCSNPENVNEHHEAFYSFGNNLRKFLEAYLFYKYPSHQAGMKRLAKFLGEDDIALAIINRCSNELSHLEEIFDRSVSPIDNAEIATLANYLLDKLYYVDKEQFNALMNSIGEPERADAVAA